MPDWKQIECCDEQAEDPKQNHCRIRWLKRRVTENCQQNPQGNRNDRLRCHSSPRNHTMIESGPRRCESADAEIWIKLDRINLTVQFLGGNQVAAFVDE